MGGIFFYFFTANGIELFRQNSENNSFDSFLLRLWNRINFRHKNFTRVINWSNSFMWSFRYAFFGTCIFAFIGKAYVWFDYLCCNIHCILSLRSTFPLVGREACFYRLYYANYENNTIVVDFLLYFTGIAKLKLQNL